VTWVAVLGCGVGCYLLKLAGLAVPGHLLERPVVRRIADLLPVALLAALIGVQVFSASDHGGQHLVVDARLAGLAVALGLLLLRMPFLVVVLGAAATAALLRLA
jgi:branched-subunit amino acid transport protein